ncbi:MAG: YggU family protein [Sedimentisphaerales bacterium]|nr:YggU family protein [Sedimentisphaerales bacterium]
MNLKLREHNDNVIFSVKIVPGSGVNRISGLLGAALKINISAPPEKGKANKELIQFLARVLNCPKSSISIISGQTDRHKKIQILDMTGEQLLNLLEPYCSL